MSKDKEIVDYVNSKKKRGGYPPEFSELKATLLYSYGCCSMFGDKVYYNGKMLFEYKDKCIVEIYTCVLYCRSHATAWIRKEFLETV